MLKANNDNPFLTSNKTTLIEVIAQMEKELQMSGENHVFKNEGAEKLILELSSFLKTMDTGSRVENLLYRVDVNLSKLDDNLPHYEALATLLWNRVFQKVWFRNQFKTG
ncbi:MAG: hypothetical protein COA58_16625 [Bacteroidetes bacterium]|nr:MAG: hypothetical protein COA58_16625 [Bacteroidota bacterium]